MIKPKQDPNWVIVGRIGKPFGIKGFSFIDAYTDSQTHLLDLMPWWDYHDPTNPKELLVHAIRAHNKRLIGRIDGCQGPDDAKCYTNHTLAIARSQLPPLQEGYYWHDLIGIHVIDEQGEHIGHLSDIFNTGSNDVWVIKNGQKTYSLAYTSEAVLAIDLATRQATVSRAHVI